jgi:hypothetical protein
VPVLREGMDEGIVETESIVDGAATSVEATPTEDDTAGATEELERTLFGGGGSSLLGAKGLLSSTVAVKERSWKSVWFKYSCRVDRVCCCCSCSESRCENDWIWE